MANNGERAKAIGGIVSKYRMDTLGMTQEQFRKYVCRMSSKIDPLFHLNLIHPYIFGNGSDLPVILVFCTVF